MVSAIAPGSSLLRLIAACTVDGIVPRLPEPADWCTIGAVDTGNRGRALALLRDGLQVLTAVESPEGRPEFHVSVSALTGIPTHPRRAPTDQEMEFVRGAFGMGGADEDNHGPGVCRHLWLDVGKSRQEPCACKQDEQRIVEGDRVRFEEEQ